MSPPSTANAKFASPSSAAPAGTQPTTAGPATVEPGEARQMQQPRTMMRSHAALYPVAAFGVAAAIFFIDTFSSLDSAAIAVAYVVVVLMSASFFSGKD